MTDPDFPLKRRTHGGAKPPYGYIPVEGSDTELQPDPDMVKPIKEALDAIDRGASLREVAAWLTTTTGNSISHQGINRIWKERRGSNPKNKREQEQKRIRRAKAPKTGPEKAKAKIKRKAADAKRILAISERKLADWKDPEAQSESVEETPEVTLTPVAMDLDFDAVPNEPDVEVVFKPNPGPQTEFLASTEREVLFGGSAGGGKGFKINSLVLTPFGWRKLGDLKVGSTICSVDGSTTKVIGYYPRGVQPFYRITFLDGAEIECDEDHLWLLHQAGIGKKVNGTRLFGQAGSKIWTTKDIYAHYQKPNSRRLGTPLADPAAFTVAGQSKGPKKFIKRDTDPYTLGVLLGDGCFTQFPTVTFASNDEEIADNVRKGVAGDITEYRYEDRSCTYYSILCQDLREHILDLGLAGTRSETKFIPRIYKYGSIEERRSLLQGLMDTDGYADEDGDSFYCSVSEELIDDVRELARSLGCLVYKTTKSDRTYTYKGERRVGQVAYELRIKSPEPESLYRLTRKRERVAGKEYQSISNWIVSVDKIEPAESICIAVDHPSRLFITDHYIVTHNTYALIADPMRYFSHPQFNGLILRRTNDELREIVWKTQEIYPKAFPGAKWHERKSQWTFPSGGRLWLTYLERPEDVLRYQGQAFCYIAFDELTQHPTPFAWDYMRSRLRSTASDLPLFMRATTNPGGPGHSWVKRMFIDPSPANTTFPATDLDTGKPLLYPDHHEKAGQPLFKRRFIPASLYDNPYLMEDGAYEANLLSLPENQRRQLLEGDWAVADGAAFPEFRQHLHVVEPFRIPPEWRRFRSCDYGYSSYSAVHWFAIDPAYEQLIVYRELYVSKHTGKDLALAVREAELGDKVDYGVLDSSCWHQRGQTGPSIAEEMIANGTRWRPSDRTAGARVNGKNQLHERLKVDEATGKPGIVFFNTCRQIIADLPVIPSDPKGSDDIDPRYASDHAYDSVRYGVMSRPRSFSPFADSRGRMPSYGWTPADPTLGY